MLDAHVLHLDGFELAVLYRLGQGFARVVGVHMHLDDVVVVHHDHTVADGVQISPQPQRIPVVPFITCNDILGAVCKGDVGVEGSGGADGLYSGCSFFLSVPGDDFSAIEYVEHGAQDDTQALSARVHHACFLQHRQQLGGTLQGGVCFVADGRPDRFRGGILFRGLPALVGGFPGHGEDGALGGLHDRLIGGLHPERQGCRQIGPIGFLPALEPLGEAPEQQGQDDARIAPRAPQQSGGRRVGGFADRGIVQAGQLPRRGRDGHGHIGAGVPVGHRENVQLIDRLLGVRQRMGRGNHRVPEQFTLYQY